MGDLGNSIRYQQRVVLGLVVAAPCHNTSENHSPICSKLKIFKKKRRQRLVDSPQGEQESLLDEGFPSFSHLLDLGLHTPPVLNSGKIS